MNKPAIGSIEYAWECIDRMDRPTKGGDCSQGWDDLMEYEIDDYVDRFAVTIDDANILWLVVQSRVDNRRCIDAVADAQRIADMIAEAQHQSFDGWTTAQRLTIEAFLSDIAWGVYNSDPNRQP